jgi:DNA-binding transcriptional regulator YhcF (GntR family)
LARLGPGCRECGGRLADQVCAQRADAIALGQFAPGARLDETALASRFAVSRTPVREALKQLAITGLVVYRPNRGSVVASLDAATSSASANRSPSIARSSRRCWRTMRRPPIARCGITCCRPAALRAGRRRPEKGARPAFTVREPAVTAGKRTGGRARPRRRQWCSFPESRK